LFCDQETTEVTKLDDQRAADFASHLPAPNGQLKECLQGKSMVRLVQFKERFGISLAAMVYRAENWLRDEARTKQLWLRSQPRVVNRRTGHVPTRQGPLGSSN